MPNYINKIKINKLLHLENLEISIHDSSCPHLIITGRNGSGKTTLLNAIADILELVASDKELGSPSLQNNDSYSRNALQTSTRDTVLSPLLDNVKENEKQSSDLNRNVDLDIDIQKLVNRYQKNQFITVFYPAFRNPRIIEPKNPTKPDLLNTRGIRNSSTSQFLYFLSDLKIQEALARNEGLIHEAEKIGNWFTNFERILKSIFEDSSLELIFNYRDYSFLIHSLGQSFRLTQLSDGYTAILEIVADLILRMQDEGNLSRVYDKKGIVLIDEVETHLHLTLQKEILPFLTTVFPNIQFIVTTHSPFVLSSLPNAVAYDLEHQEELTKLTDYSFEALSEGYFGVKSQSSYIYSELERLKELIIRETPLSDVEKFEVKEIVHNFNEIPSSVLPALKGEYEKFYISNATRIKEVLNRV